MNKLQQNVKYDHWFFIIQIPDRTYGTIWYNAFVIHSIRCIFIFKMYVQSFGFGHWISFFFFLFITVLNVICVNGRERKEGFKE